jgi:UDP-N-acetylmuramyl pentapeptide phosphotransferase/UDP-N-acetylglucosamine-1-phosphate transferase
MFDFWNHIPYSSLVASILAMILAGFVSNMAIPVIVRIARAKGLVDKPNHRTSHEGAVPLLGGVAVFGGILLGVSLFIPEDDRSNFRHILAALVILFFVGQKDDIIGISWQKKFIAQLASACILVFFGDFRFASLHGFAGIHELPFWVSAIISIFLFILIINAFNLIDGIDGLASGTGILISGIFGVWLHLTDHAGLAVVAWSLTGGLIPFFIYNVFGTKNKLFLGDTGSLIIGMLMAVFASAVCKEELPKDHMMYMRATPSVAIAVLIYPLFDLLRVITIRLFKGQSPFTADRNHVHHLFIDAGISHRRSTFYILLITVGAIFIAWILRNQSILLLGVVLLVWILGITVWVKYYGRRGTRA